MEKMKRDFIFRLSQIHTKWKERKSPPFLFFSRTGWPYFLTAVQITGLGQVLERKVGKKNERKSPWKMDRKTFFILTGSERGMGWKEWSQRKRRKREKGKEGGERSPKHERVPRTRIRRSLWFISGPREGEMHSFSFLFSLFLSSSFLHFFFTSLTLLAKFSSMITTYTCQSLYYVLW